MSKCCKQHYEPCCCEYGHEEGGLGNIYSLLILILIVCQFCKGEGKIWGKHDEEEGGVDNSILFIIAIFVLVYCSCGKGLFGGNQCC